MQSTVIGTMMTKAKHQLISCDIVDHNSKLILFKTTTQTTSV